ncbi:orotidine-5'-phosphate decarboxylase [Alicyclobacillus herbarius]|uniref:orotidine-5'-phosphate decarboxylase n=1 Tax=Alicyclobacillus herbarius TaxID=122960 RepID=UPI0005503A57|nr:orotidine-5'-phosphate decarboxylase [Alicyclobacillus herbarius]
MDESLFERLSSPVYDGVRARTYLALDVPNVEQARQWLARFGDVLYGYKVGLELFYAAGPAFLEELARLGKRVFLDVKLHDIPNTVAGALRSLCQYPLEMVNVHAAAGRRALEAARMAVDQSPFQPLLIGVTVLTSLDAPDLGEIGIDRPPEPLVMQLARLVKACGLDGVVASAREAAKLKMEFGPEFELVIPGTRPAFADKGDQQRTMSPGQALAAGATRLVMGRAVTKARNPELALLRIWDEMREAVTRTTDPKGSHE